MKKKAKKKKNRVLRLTISPVLQAALAAEAKRRQTTQVTLARWILADELLQTRFPFAKAPRT